MNADVHEQESILTAVMSGVKSDEIRRRLLEKPISFKDCIETAQAVEDASVNTKAYGRDSWDTPQHVNALTDDPVRPTSNKFTTPATDKNSCGNCGMQKHKEKKQCPARSATCYNCNRIGHWSHCCRGKRKNTVNAIPGATYLTNPSI